MITPLQKKKKKLREVLMKWLVIAVTKTFFRGFEVCYVLLNQMGSSGSI